MGARLAEVAGPANCHRGRVRPPPPVDLSPAVNLWWVRAGELWGMVWSLGLGMSGFFFLALKLWIFRMGICGKQ